MKYLPEAKTSEASQKFCKNPKFKILDYLPCPCKFPIQNDILAQKVYLFANFYNVCCLFYDKLRTKYRQENNLPFHE